MPETKKKLPLFGREIDVSEVPVKSAEESVNRYVLEDGPVLKVKGVASSFLRLDGQYLPDGNPVYVVMMSPITTVESSPLRKVVETTGKEK